MDTTTAPPNQQANKQRLERPTEGRVLGGVAAGISRHTGASVALIRLGFLVAALFAGFGIILYAAAWALLPGEQEQNTAAERWLENLTTPGKRAGAFLIGLAALVVLAGAAPFTILAAVVLLAAAALLAPDTKTEPTPDGAASTVAPSTEETE
jgi:phage shock protein PspC (stress-responsive transcriptional regulator)